jgi:HNH endonuclease
MIRLTKLTLGDEIIQHITETISEYQRLIDAGKEIPKSISDRYKSSDIKASLWQETKYKCAYCESRIQHIDYGDVEHMQPKINGAWHRFAYENLTIACGVCNTNKHQHLGILNPYVDEPSDHLMAEGPMVIRRPGSDSGMITEQRLRLNRPALLERRTERLDAVARLWDQYARTLNAGIRGVLLAEIRRECSAEMEYSFVVSEYVRRVEVHLAVEH